MQHCKKILTFIFFTIASCTHLQQSTVDFFESPEGDQSYAKVYKENTRESKVFKDLETELFLHITYISPTFEEALKTRGERILSKAKPLPIKNVNKRVFFVSAFSPNEENIDFKTDNLLDIHLKVAGSKLFPEEIIELEEKKKWKLFFPYINQWTREFIIVFNKEQENPLPPGSIHFNLSNGNSLISLKW